MIFTIHCRTCILGWVCTIQILQQHLITAGEDLDDLDRDLSDLSDLVRDLSDLSDVISYVRRAQVCAPTRVPTESYTLRVNQYIEGFAANLAWVRFLVVCFLDKTKPNPRKPICCGKKWP